MEKPIYPQASTTSLVSRVKNENTALYVSLEQGRSARRQAAQQVNYAELDRDDFLEDELDDEFILDRYTRTQTLKQMSPYNHNSHAASGSSDGAKFDGKPAQMTKHLNYDEQRLVYNASLPEVLIPIKVSCDYQSSKIVDFFMWNVNEQLVTPEHFALIMCQDLELPNSYQQLILNQIKQQIEDFQAVPASVIGAEDSENGILTAETHVIINLSVNLDTNFYEDKFEWDLNNNELSPEQFATTVVQDLGLLPEFKTAIAHSLHDTILKLKREFLDNNQLSLLQHYDISKLNLSYQTSPITSTNYNVDQQGLRHDLKNLGDGWYPTVEELTKWEIEKREIEKERNIRRLKRETMRVGDDFSVPKRRGRRRKDEL